MARKARASATKKARTPSEHPIFDQMVKETSVDPRKNWRPSTPPAKRGGWEFLEKGEK